MATGDSIFHRIPFSSRCVILEEEIRDYYQYDYAKEFAGRTKGTYNQARAEILELLTQQRIDNLLDRWLNQTEASTKVRWLGSNK